MELHYDDQGDAAFVYVAGPVEPGTIEFTDLLDQDRTVSYDAEDRVLVYEFLDVRRHGVKLDDLEHRDELRAVFREAGVAERDWSTPRSAARRIDGKRRGARSGVEAV